MHTANGLLNQMWDALLWQWWKAERKVAFPEIDRPEDIKPEDITVILTGDPGISNVCLLVGIDGQTFRIQVEETTEGGPKGLVDLTSLAHDIFRKTCQGNGCPYCVMAAINGLTT